jgi:RimJ/RimL family protein N-acetyltransferase
MRIGPAAMPAVWKAGDKAHVLLEEDNLAFRRVMEKLDMTLVRRFRLTPEDIVRADRYHAVSLEVWDGDDIEYALERADWEQRG